MTATARNAVIASAVGVLAACLGGGLLIAGPPEPAPLGSSVQAWFNRQPANSGQQPVPVRPVADDKQGAMEKFSARLSNMGKSVKSAFSRSSQKVTAQKAAREDDAISLAKPAQPKADFYLSLARIQERGGNLAAAIEQYKRGLELDPDNLACLLSVARLYDRQGQLDDAMKYYQHATKSHPEEAAAFNDQGLCYARQQQYAESIASLRKAVELRPDRVLYRNNLATVQVEMGEVDEALKTLAKVHGNAVAHYNIAFLLNKRGETVQALEQFKLAAAADPAFEAAQQWADTLSAKLSGNALIAQGTHERSMRPSEEVAAVAGKTADESRPAQGSLVTGPQPQASETQPGAARSNIAIKLPRAEKPAAQHPIVVRQTPATAEPATALASDAQGSAAVASAPTKIDTPAAAGLVQNASAPEPARVLRLDRLSPPSPPPGPAVEIAAQQGRSVTTSRQTDGDSKSPYNEKRRPETTALVAERPTRLPPTGLPPTPDEIDDYSRSLPPLDGERTIMPLPPVDPGHYAPSRY